MLASPLGTSASSASCDVVVTWEPPPGLRRELAAPAPMLLLPLMLLIGCSAFPTCREGERNEGLEAVSMLPPAPREALWHRSPQQRSGEEFPGPQVHRTLSQLVAGGEVPTALFEQFA